MTGIAAKRPRIGKRIKDSKMDEDKIYALLRRSDTPTAVGSTGSSGSVGAGSAGGGPYLEIAGGSMVGAIAFYPKLVTIAAGAIDISAATGTGYSTRVIISPESGNTDDLVTITGAENAGQLLILQGVETDTITIKTTGNIETINGSDYVLDNDDNIAFLFDTTDNKWQQITLGNIHALVNTWTGTNSFTGPVFSVTSANMFLGDAVTDNLAITARLGSDLYPITDNTYDLGDATHRYGNIYGGVIIGGSVTATTSLTSSGSTILGDAITDTISFGGRMNTDIYPITDNTYDLGDATHRWANLYSGIITGGSISATTSLSSTGSTFLGDQDTDVTTLTGIMVVNDSSAPTNPIDATTVKLFLNSATGELSVQKNTGTVSLEDNGSQTPWTSDIDGDGYDLLDLGNQIVFRDDASITTDSDTLTINDNASTAANARIYLALNAVAEYEISPSSFDFGTNYLVLDSISSPGTTGSVSNGRIFLNSANNHHASIIRNGSVIDLELGNTKEIVLNTATDPASNTRAYTNNEDFFKVYADGGLTTSVTATSEPSTGTFLWSYTFTTADYPDGITGFTFDNYRIYMLGLAKNVSAGASDLHVVISVGGSEWTELSRTSVPAGDYVFFGGENLANSDAINVENGDVIGVKMWTTSSGDFELQDIGFIMMPYKTTVSAQSVTCGIGTLMVHGVWTGFTGITLDESISQGFDIFDSNNFEWYYTDQITISGGTPLIPSDDIGFFASTETTRKFYIPKLEAFAKYSASY